MIDGDDKMSLGARQLMIRALWRKESAITHFEVRTLFLTYRVRACGNHIILSGFKKSFMEHWARNDCAQFYYVLESPRSHDMVTLARRGEAHS